VDRQIFTFIIAGHIQRVDGQDENVQVLFAQSFGWSFASSFICESISFSTHALTVSVSESRTIVSNC
jgi:hypothetical protein